MPDQQQSIYTAIKARGDAAPGSVTFHRLQAPRGTSLPYAVIIIEDDPVDIGFGTSAELRQVSWDCVITFPGPPTMTVDAIMSTADDIWSQFHRWSVPSTSGLDGAVNIGIDRTTMRGGVDPDVLVVIQRYLLAGTGKE